MNALLHLKRSRLQLLIFPIAIKKLCKMREVFAIAAMLFAITAMF
jgi:hypothetical protein